MTILNLRRVALTLALLALPGLASAHDCPSQPNGFVAAVEGADLIFRWDNATDCRITSYELQVSLAPNIGSQPLTSVSFFRFLNPPSSSIRFSGVGRTPRVYYARLVAFAGAARSVPSPEVIIVVGGGCGVARAPSNVTATAQPFLGAGVYTFSWLPPSGCQPEMYGVIVERDTNVIGESVWIRVADRQVPIPTLTLFIGSAQLQLAATYRVRVRSLTRQGASAEAEATFTVSNQPSFPPGPITNFRVDAMGEGVVRFTWDGGAGIFGSAAGPTTYTLLVSQSPNDPQPLRSPIGVVFSGVRLQAGVSGVFYLRLVAVNGAGESLPSNEAALYLPPR